jgi:hypothetical protein
LLVTELADEGQAATRGCDDAAGERVTIPATGKYVAAVRRTVL